MSSSPAHLVVWPNPHPLAGGQPKCSARIIAPFLLISATGSVPTLHQLSPFGALLTRLECGTFQSRSGSCKWQSRSSSRWRVWEVVCPAVRCADSCSSPSKRAREQSCVLIANDHAVDDSKWVTFPASIEVRDAVQTRADRNRGLCYIAPLASGTQSAPGSRAGGLIADGCRYAVGAHHNSSEQVPS